MRRFIRHPSDIPIEIRFPASDGFIRHRVQDVAFGGLAFLSDQPAEPETIVALRMPHLRPPFEAPAARVAWCRRMNGGYAVGVQFLESEEAFRVRMVEQVCHIESYRRDIERREGRHLSSDDAAGEWISRHAAAFPNP